ncbi:hypothetical protein [Tropicibacter naphthalenivorans]|uniref:DUF3618 domain-containing protein n=1 Tax=Tropicibacter naphthalenivorans TaxID=441103 RepID=A0A0P1G238_9RHOB|nr:hypothetical protein [Tropicibacter naphthalenivorans]CUH75659.1 hypothetical protein TRN7648_00551 [Tropicibacter naphthalenivorans]SMC42959.1 hypothetical protein SAMN04488093_101328 [Tropicibacter naphthalenivorans]
MTHHPNIPDATTAKQAAMDARDAVAETAEAHAEEVRDEVADRVDQTAEAAHQAADAYDPNSLQAQLLSQLAGNIEGLTDKLRGKTVEDMAQDAATFARRNPALVLGGAAVAGFALARFLKAKPQETRQITQDPWTGHLDSREVM